MGKQHVSLRKLEEDLITLGVEQGDLLLVHSSLSAIGLVDGGADTVIDALLKVLGTEGTLLMPAFQGGSEFVILSELSSGKCPPFDLRSAPSELGKITEVFRGRQGVIRSISPTHSTCGIGPLAADILKGHGDCNVTTGDRSPYDKIGQQNGKILLLGVDHSANTTLHFVENSNGAPTLSSIKFSSTVIDMDGKSHNVECYSHMPAGLKRVYQKVDPILSEKGLQVKGSIGQAASTLIDAAGMTDLIGRHVRENPLYLIEPFKPE